MKLTDKQQIRDSQKNQDAVGEKTPLEALENKTKKELVEIAVKEHCLPEGLANRLSRNRLFDRIQTAVRNEQTHEAIARMAGKPRANR